MKNKKYLIAIDIGTTSVKCIRFAQDLKIQEKTEFPLETLRPNPETSEQNPEEIFEAVVKGINALVVSTEELLAASFSCAMHSLICMDKDGKAISNAIIWADTRSINYAEAIKNSSEGKEIYQQTGTPIHPMAPLAKIAWLQEEQPEIFQKSAKFISIKEYVFFRLYGKYVVDYSIASATGLFDVFELKWNEKALEKAGITESQLSTAFPITHYEKGILRAFKESLKIDLETPFVLGGSDGCLANLGANAIQKGDAAVTIGTSGAIRVMAKNSGKDEKQRIFNYILTENHYVLGGAINNGGVALKWFAENMDDQDPEKKDYSQIIDRIAKIAPGSNGLIFLPYLLGERAPHWDANAKGVFFGVNINHTRDHFLRAVMEGVIFGIYDIGRALEEVSGDIKRIYAGGGFAKSEEWVQMLADVFGKEVLITDSHENSAMGAAIISLKSIGLVGELEDIKDFTNIKKVFKPNFTNHHIYQKNFSLFQKLYQSLKNDF
ncbi:gluconokinase [Flexithrix dorotheae]|uniref:gluconokinase n=1 Tax=Flexithrix dorotheae TaxID=70993 RepID=UPI00037CE3C2|nr:gluconokinase [Flexithrix dorotheae]